jgi:hypothetical protein
MVLTRYLVQHVTEGNAKHGLLRDVAIKTCLDDKRDQA